MSSASISSNFGSATLQCGGNGNWTLPSPAPSPNPVTYLNILNFGAKPDAIWGRTDCSVDIAVNASLVTCGHYSFASGDKNKTIILDDAGMDTSGNRIPLVATINGLSGSGATISTPANFSVPVDRITTFDIFTTSNGSGYSFGSTQTTHCGSGCSAISVAKGQPIVLSAVSGSPNSGTGGTGGTSDNGSPTGSCTVTVVGGSSNQIALAGQPSQFVVSLVLGGISSVTSTPSRGGYIIGDNIANYNSTTGNYLEPVTGCGNLTGAKINIQYGVLVERVVAGTGLYVHGDLPDCQGAANGVHIDSSTDAGTGLKLTCTTESSTTSWGTDNSTAFESAIGSQSSPAPGTMNYGSVNAMPTCIYIPAGNYLTQIFNPNGPNSLFVAKGYGCWLGDEHYHSNIFVVPNQQGDLFSWLDSNKNGAQTDFANTQTFSDFRTFNQAGSSFRNITVIGNRNSTATQNALQLYGPTQFAYVDNCVVSYVRGEAFGAGFSDNTSSQSGTFEESRVQNCHFDHDGDGNANLPAFEITSKNMGGSNNLDLVNLRFYDSLGPGVWIHQFADTTNSYNNAHGIRILNVKIEGSGVSKANVPATGGMDLIEFGNDSASNQNIANVMCRNLEVINPVLGSAAIHVAGPQAQVTQRFDCEGNINGTPGGGYGRGLQIDACQQCGFKEASNGVIDYDLYVGPAGSGGSAAISSPGVIYDGNGGESLLKTFIDPTSASLVQFPLRQLYAYSSTTGLDANRVLSVEPLISSITSTTGITFTVTGTPLVFQIGVNSPLWTIIRTGPATGAFTDKWDTVTNIQTALGVTLEKGQVFHSRVCNQSSQPETIQGNTGITTAGTTSVGANQCINFAFVVTGASAITVYGG